MMRGRRRPRVGRRCGSAIPLPRRSATRWRGTGRSAGCGPQRFLWRFPMCGKAMIWSSSRGPRRSKDPGSNSPPTLRTASSGSASGRRRHPSLRRRHEPACPSSAWRGPGLPLDPVADPGQELSIRTDMFGLCAGRDSHPRGLAWRRHGGMAHPSLQSVGRHGMGPGSTARRLRSGVRPSAGRNAGTSAGIATTPLRPHIGPDALRSDPNDAT
jgi:hypothetical protein